MFRNFCLHRIRFCICSANVRFDCLHSFRFHLRLHSFCFRLPGQYRYFHRDFYRFLNCFRNNRIQPLCSGFRHDLLISNCRLCNLDNCLLKDTLLKLHLYKIRKFFLPIRLFCRLLHLLFYSFFCLLFFRFSGIARIFCLSGVPGIFRLSGRFLLLQEPDEVILRILNTVLYPALYAR